MKTRDRDERWMQLALELARQGEGLTRPNPPVGAVVVRNGRVVGRGWHPASGLPHAEVFALHEAGLKAQGATLYVTLEPCCTWGRTPPCTDRILHAGVGRVVAAIRDPNPRHAGRGFRRLREAGVAVEVGCGAAEATDLLAPFAHWITTGRPYVTLKLGMTLDGRIGDHAGRSRWITGAESRRRVQALRRSCDAILVGGGTVRADNPTLQPKPARGRAPYRVVVSAAGRLPAGAAVLNDAHAAQTLVAVTARCAPAQQARLSRRGARVWVLPEHEGRVSLKALLTRLGREAGVLHVLCEGGGELAGSLIGQRLVNEAWCFLAPGVLGADGIPAVAGPGWALERMPRFRVRSVETVGADVLIRAAEGR